MEYCWMGALRLINWPGEHSRRLWPHLSNLEVKYVSFNFTPLGHYSYISAPFSLWTVYEHTAYSTMTFPGHGICMFVWIMVHIAETDSRAPDYISHANVAHVRMGLADGGTSIAQYSPTRCSWMDPHTGSSADSKYPSLRPLFVRTSSIFSMNRDQRRRLGRRNTGIRSSLAYRTCQEWSRYVHHSKLVRRYIHGPYAMWVLLVLWWSIRDEIVLVCSARANDGTNVIGYHPTGNDNQKWIIRKDEANASIWKCVHWPSSLCLPCI